ncbi:cytochrome b5-like heme/steroid binding domain-containing protein [Talaromyces proteolyticus]|uniref:Cytochrome b5-like heme/steroid binding domain-containing protein n=1 Tax=Talaromyces proteolyticus TaxID=1131652 RepID=A0AAD4PZA0_9EURO|nr:cytochrome b5-like heme/steroid binding domain-containing protein [Talaromyces proteolyticus]KAH8695459.1 cytochrome b5-like heme/steroid binding domain-containing protein [Talaromyces proteolyticus]
MSRMLNFVSRRSAKIEELPFISAEGVKQQNGKENSKLWLVIDDIVYDCSTFARQHPGGEAVLKNFGGKDCSWQYHKIHGMNSNKANKLLPKLRIGRTKAVENPYDKPKTDHVEFIRVSTGYN